MTERLNGEDGLGAIYPAMANSVHDVRRARLSAKSDPSVVQARAAIERLLVVKDNEAYCQPCVSPVWDTALASHALMESREATPDDQTVASVRSALDWLKPLQVLDVAGDWAKQKPHVRPGGWAFQYANAYYPDLDDTAVVALAMDRAAKNFPAPPPANQTYLTTRRCRARGNGFWACKAPMAASAPSTPTMTATISTQFPSPIMARCSIRRRRTSRRAAFPCSAQFGETARTNPALGRAVEYLVREQESDGSWFGRWGMNYIYGTWSVLSALNAIDLRPQRRDGAKSRRLAETHPECGRRLGGGWRKLCAGV